MLDFYKEMCTGDIWSALTRPLGDYDLMIEEALAACEAAMTRSLSFSLPRSPSMEEQRSPVYVANCRANWDKLVELNKEAATLGYGNVIHFGPGVQQEIEGHVITTGITEQVAELILEERRNAIVKSIFVPCEQLVLETPATPK